MAFPNGIAVLLFPLLKKHGEGIALGYVGIRIIEAMILVVSKINLLSLIPLSEDYLSAGAPAATYEALGLLTLGQRFWASKLQVPFFVVGALILPRLAALSAIAVLAAKWTIVVEKVVEVGEVAEA